MSDFRAGPFIGEIFNNSKLTIHYPKEWGCGDQQFFALDIQQLHDLRHLINSALRKLEGKGNE